MQRVASASVTIDTHLVSSIGKGVLVFAAVAPDDSPKEVESMAAKVLKLKMWPDEAGGTVQGYKIDRAYVCTTRALTGFTSVETQRRRYQRRGTMWWVDWSISMAKAVLHS